MPTRDGSSPSARIFAATAPSGTCIFSIFSNRASWCDDDPEVVAPAATSPVIAGGGGRGGVATGVSLLLEGGVGGRLAGLLALNRREGMSFEIGSSPFGESVPEMTISEM